MRYTVIERQSLEQLTTDVNELILQGWLPLGGVSASTLQIQGRHDDWDNQAWYAQAMTNDKL